MVKCLNVVLVLVVLLCTVGIGSAATYYVDTASIGGTASDSNNGTIGYPWLTISKANSELVAGDTVYLRNGTYEHVDGVAIWPSSSGTGVSYITYSGYNDENITLKGKGLYDAVSGQRGLIISNNIDYINIANITVESPFGSYLVTYYNTYWNFNNCTFQHTLSDDTRPIRLYNSEHLSFIDCYMDASDITGAVYLDLIANHNSIHLLFLRTYIGTATHNGYEEYWDTNTEAYNVFRECIIENKYHSGIGIGEQGSSRYLIDDCTFKNMGSLPNPNNLNDAGHDPALYQRTQYSIVRKNIFYNNNNHWNTRTSTPMKEFRDNWMYQNTMYEAIEHNPVAGDLYYTGAAWFIGTGITTTDKMFNNHMLNNIVWDAEEEIQIAFDYSDSPYDPYDNVISYNVMGDPINPLLTRWRDSLGTGGENLTATEANNVDWVSGTNIESDPLFTDATNNDFTLQGLSPAINAGTWLTTITSSTNTGQTSIIVGDATPFYSGAGEPWLIEGEVGDTIKTAAGEETVIQSINYTTDTLTVSPAIDIVNGEGLSLAYNGTAPDIGAFETTAATATVTNTSGVWNFWTYENIPELHTAVNDESVLGYSGGIYTFYEPFYQNKSTDTFYFNETVHLKSNVDANPAYFKWAGTNIIDDSNVTGWNTAAGAAATTEDSTIAYMYGENTSTGDITDSKFSNLGYFAWTKYGLFLDGYSGVTINNNTFSNNRDGFVMSLSNGNTITNNTAHSNTYGLHFSTCNNNDISNNNVYSNSKHGIRLIASSNNTLTDNNVSDTSGGYYDYSMESNAENNTVTLSTKASEYFNVDNTINSLLFGGIIPYTIGYPLIATVMQDNAITGTENANVTITSGTVDYVHVTSGLSATTNYSMFYSVNDTTIETQLTDGSGAANFTTNLSAATYYIDETVQVANDVNFTFADLAVSPATVVQGASSTVSLNITDADGTISDAIVKILGVNYTMAQSGITWSYTYSATTTVEKHYVTNVYAQDNSGEWNSTTSSLYIDVLTASTGGGGGGGSTTEDEEDDTQYAPSTIPSIETANITLEPVTYAGEIESYIMGESISLFRINIGTGQPVYTKRVFNSDISECSAPNGSIVTNCTVSEGFITIYTSPILDGIYSTHDGYVILKYTDGLNYHAPVKVTVFDMMGSVGNSSIKVSGLPGFIFAYDSTDQNVTGLTFWFTVSLLIVAGYLLVRRNWG